MSPSTQLSRSLRNYFVHDLRGPRAGDSARGPRTGPPPASDRLGARPLLRGARCVGDYGLEGDASALMRSAPQVQSHLII